MTPIVIIFTMQKGHTAMLQSLFGYRPRPAFADLSGFDIRYFFLGFVHRSARDVFAFSHTKNFICHNLFAVIKHIPNQFFRYCRFGFGRITAEEFFGAYLTVTVQLIKTVFVSKVECHRLALGCQRRFVVNDEAHIRFFAKATDEQHATGGGTEVNRTKTTVL